MLKLRDYQERCCKAVWGLLEAGNNALLQAPTGSGKSCIVAAICNKAATLGLRVVVLVDREILVSQLASSIAKFYPNLRNGLVCSGASKKIDHSQPVTIASRQTLVNHLNTMEPVNIIIADEAHMINPPRAGKEVDQYNQIINRLLEYNPKTRIFGCSATPYRLNNGFIYGNKHHPLDLPFFDDLAEKITFKELTEAGHLAPLVGKIIDTNLELADISLVAGEFNLGALSAAMCLHIDSISEVINEHCQDRSKIMVFCVDIKHANLVAKAAGGVSYHSKLPRKVRNQIIKEFKHGAHRIICSVATLTTGFDDPGVDCIIQARPTMSPSLHIQMIGRGLRPADGKTNCLLIDLTNNTTTHTPTNDLDNVFIKITRINGTGDGTAPFKICEGVMDNGSQCLAELHPKVCFCPECGFEFVKTVAEAAPQLTDTDFGPTELPPPEWVDVTSLAVSIHDSHSGKKLLKVDLGVDCLNMRYPFVSDWICTKDHYSGYAVKMGKEKWQKYTVADMPDTDLVGILWEAQERFNQPLRAEIQKKMNGYYELKDLDFIGSGEDMTISSPVPDYNDEVPF